MQKYVDDDGDEINESEFRDSFSKGAGGSWDFDGEHGGDFSVKISPTPVAKSDEFDAGTVMISLGGLRPGTVAPRSPGSSKRTRSNFGATLAKRSLQPPRRPFPAMPPRAPAGAPAAPAWAPPAPDGP